MSRWTESENLVFTSNTSAPGIWNLELKQPDQTLVHLAQLNLLKKVFCLFGISLLICSSTMFSCTTICFRTQPEWLVNLDNNHFYTIVVVLFIILGIGMWSFITIMTKDVERAWVVVNLITLALFAILFGFFLSLIFLHNYFYNQIPLSITFEIISDARIAYAVPTGFLIYSLALIITSIIFHFSHCQSQWKFHHFFLLGWMCVCIFAIVGCFFFNGSARMRAFIIFFSIGSIGLSFNSVALNCLKFSNHFKTINNTAAKDITDNIVVIFAVVFINSLLVAGWYIVKLVYLLVKDKPIDPQQEVV